MILFISDPREDYQDSIFYAFKRIFGKEVIVYRDKPAYFEAGPEMYRNCHYMLDRTPCSDESIVAAAKSGELKGVFVICGYNDVHALAVPLLNKILPYGKKWPLVVIDGHDDDRVRYNFFDQYPCPFDFYFKRELHLGIREHPEGHDKRQTEPIANGIYPDKVYPLPFCVIPEKFPKRLPRAKQFNVNFRCGSVQHSPNRREFMLDFNYPNSLIDLNFPNTPIHMQDRADYFASIDVSKVNLNLIGGGNDCYRFWEVLGAGGFVLSQDHDQIIEPDFTPGENYDTFTTKQEMYYKIDFYCKNDTLREKIALSGYNFTMTNHTCYNRLNFIIDTIHTKFQF